MRGSLDGAKIAPLMACCDIEHPPDRHDVEKRWIPDRLRCLIVGENPGDVGARYFYSDTLKFDRVIVRRNLLAGLHAVGLISAPTLAAFSQAGFLFDHAIRCRLPSAVVAIERRLAMRFASPRASDAHHLEPLIRQANAVWAMGYIARCAVAALCPEFPRDHRRIGSEPYPCQVPEAPKFFVSRYFTRVDETVPRAICARFKPFFLQRNPDAGVCSGAV